MLAETELPFLGRNRVLFRLNVVEQVFGKRTHFQLIHRANELIKLLFNEKDILESEIDMIWDTCRKQGEQIHKRVDQRRKRLPPRSARRR